MWRRSGPEQGARLWTAGGKFERPAFVPPRVCAPWTGMTEVQNEKAKQNRRRTRSLYQGGNGGHLRVADRHGDFGSARRGQLEGESLARRTRRRCGSP